MQPSSSTCLKLVITQQTVAFVGIYKSPCKQELLSHNLSCFVIGLQFDDCSFDLRGPAVETCQKTEVSCIYLLISFYSVLSPALKQLHWLPFCFCIQFKVLVTPLKDMHGLGPTYLKDHLSPYVLLGHLRSSGGLLQEVPLLKVACLASTKACAFSIVASTLWNWLPEEVEVWHLQQILDGTIIPFYI